MQKETEFNLKKCRKYIPLAIILPVLFVTGVVLNPLADICLFAFTVIIIAILKDISESYIYENNESLLINLPFYFLALTAIFQIR